MVCLVCTPFDWGWNANLWINSAPFAERLMPDILPGDLVHDCCMCAFWWMLRASSLAWNNRICTSDFQLDRMHYLLKCERPADKFASKTIVISPSGKCSWWTWLAGLSHLNFQCRWLTTFKPVSAWWRIFTGEPIHPSTPLTLELNRNVEFFSMPKTSSLCIWLFIWFECCQRELKYAWNHPHQFIWKIFGCWVNELFIFVQ